MQVVINIRYALRLKKRTFLAKTISLWTLILKMIFITILILILIVKWALSAGSCQAATSNFFLIDWCKAWSWNDYILKLLDYMHWVQRQFPRKKAAPFRKIFWLKFFYRHSHFIGNRRIGDIVRHVFKTITHALIKYNNLFFAKKGSISYFKLSQSNPIRPKGISVTFNEPIRNETNR